MSFKYQNSYCQAVKAQKPSPISRECRHPAKARAAVTKALRRGSWILFREPRAVLLPHVCVHALDTHTHVHVSGLVGIQRRMLCPSRVNVVGRSPVHRRSRSSRKKSRFGKISLHREPTYERTFHFALLSKNPSKRMHSSWARIGRVRVSER